MFRKALANDPEFLLMDEPFGALDAQTRLIMQEILLKVWEDTGKTILFVTHDVNEAVFLVEKVYVMTARPGKLKYIQNIDFERPRHPDINTLLKSYPLFVYRVDDHYSEMTDVYIEKNQLHPSKIVELGSLPAIKKAVLNGIGRWYYFFSCHPAGTRSKHSGLSGFACGACSCILISYHLKK